MATKSAGRWAAGIDLGGTGLRVLVAGPDHRVRGSAHAATDREGGAARVLDQLEAAVAAAVREAGAAPGDLGAAGIGVAAAVDTAGGVVLNAPNLRWRNFPLGSRLSRRLGVPVVVENDVNAALVGEHARGAARGVPDAVGIWVGTGVGGAVLLGGHIHQGHRGSAGEIGHMVVEPDGPACGCGNSGCLEALASRTALQRALAAAIARGERTALVGLMRRAGETAVSMRTIAAAIRRGDRVTIRELGRVQRYLALATANCVNLLDPLMVVFGGGLATLLGARFLAPVRTIARERFLNRRAVSRVRIVLSTLADSAGALGALALAFRRLRPRSGR